MQKFICFLFAVLFLMLFIPDASAQKKKTKKLSSKDSSLIKTGPPESPKEIVIKYGTASFYAQKFNGRKTANGNIYNSSKLTAACNQLPLGTWVKVTNLKNEKSVIVYINDRLHHKNNRLIDLSKSAAEKLSYINSGLTKVKVEVLGKIKPG